MIPSKIHTAFNPIIFDYVQDGGELFEQLDINVGADIITLKREYLNSKATFDISSVINKYFAEKLVDSINPAPTSIYVEPYLYANYSVGGNRYMAVNAVNQIRESFDYSSNINKPLITMPSVKKYSGYPLSVAILVGDKVIKTNLGDLIPNAVNVVQLTDTTPLINELLYLATPEGDHILTITGDKIVVDAFSICTPEIACTPQAPFYVRWINNRGGIDYKMFSITQKRTTSLTENQVYQRHIVYFYNENGTDYSYAKKAAQTITVGAGMLGNAEHDAMAGLTLAPYIELYDNSQWKRVIIASSSVTRDTQNAYNDVEMTFVMPEIYLQY